MMIWNNNIPGSTDAVLLGVLLKKQHEIGVVPCPVFSQNSSFYGKVNLKSIISEKDRKVN